MAWDDLSQTEQTYSSSEYIIIEECKDIKSIYTYILIQVEHSICNEMDKHQFDYNVCVYIYVCVCVCVCVCVNVYIPYIKAMNYINIYVNMIGLYIDVSVIYALFQDDRSIDPRVYGVMGG